MPESASIALDRDVTRESEKGGGAKRVECELSGYSMRVGYSFSIVKAHFSQRAMNQTFSEGPIPDSKSMSRRRATSRALPVGERIELTPEWSLSRRTP